MIIYIGRVMFIKIWSSNNTIKQRILNTPLSLYDANENLLKEEWTFKQIVTTPFF